MTVCLSHGGRTTYESQMADEELHVATLDGVAILRRSGGGWASIGRRDVTPMPTWKYG